MMKGTSASAGIGIGKAAIVEETELVIKKETISDAAAEKERFHAALNQAMEETDALAKDLATRVGEKEAEILNGHLMLLSDPMLTGEIENTIAGENACSEYAIESVCNMYADMFASMGDELMQQRATDMRDIKTRMQKILLGVSSVDIASLPAGSIIVAKDLTPQFIRLFVGRFGDTVSVLHSALSAGERYDSWKKIRSGRARVVIGTRSAVFAPVRDLGLIVLDEEQDSAYKSEQSPRYHARDVAKRRVQQENAVLVLGSATPSIESYYGAQQGRYPMFTLRERYQGAALPQVTIADIRGESRAGWTYTIGQTLYEALQENLERGEQSILFLNRRGNSRVIGCSMCGWVPECPSCSTTLTYHSVSGRAMCHFCGASIEISGLCPVCYSPHLFTECPGTQKVEEELHTILPKARVLRMDADTTSKKGSHHHLLEIFAKGRADILLGTQMVAKGLDFDHVTLVGVLDADQSLFAQDYRAKERTFSLITQVVGRAGRRGKQGRAIIQTYNPDHPVLLCAARQDYEQFYADEIESRQALLMPPVEQMLMLTGTGENESDVLAALLRLKQRILSLMEGQFSDFHYPVLGPSPASVVRVMGRYRYHLILRCPDNKRRRQLISGVLIEFSKDNKNRGVSLFADLNPDTL